ncbi:MAG: methyltransferase domain-containing protein [Spirochaetota bacterium]|nr:MAG: methyltransferase domain-containing protein [Spirochaetota bacterium]
MGQELPVCHLRQEQGDRGFLISSRSLVNGNTIKASCPYIKKDHNVADLVCGSGYYALALHESVDSKSRFYAVDSDGKVIRGVERKATKCRYYNIETHASSDVNLSFIKHESVDFVLVDEVLCCMAPKGHRQPATK